MPLWQAASGDKRGSKVFFAVLHGTAISEPEPVIFSCDPENWALWASHFRVDRERYHFRSHQFLRSRCNCTVARLASRVRGARFLQP